MHASQDMTDRDLVLPSCQDPNSTSGIKNSGLLGTQDAILHSGPNGSTSQDPITQIRTCAGTQHFSQDPKPQTQDLRRNSGLQSGPNANSGLAQGLGTFMSGPKYRPTRDCCRGPEKKAVPMGLTNTRAHFAYLRGRGKSDRPLFFRSLFSLK